MRSSSQFAAQTGQSLTWVVLSLWVLALSVGAGPQPRGIVAPRPISGVTNAASGGITSAMQEAQLRGVSYTDRFRVDDARVRQSARRFSLCASTAPEQQRAAQMDLIRYTERVKVNGMLQQRGVDYWLDYDSKTLIFLRDLDQEAIVETTFRWVPKPEAARRASGLVGPGIIGEASPAASIGSRSPALGTTPDSLGYQPRLKVVPLLLAKENEANLRAYLVGTTREGLSLGGQTHLQLSYAHSERQAQNADPSFTRLQRMVASPRKRAQVEKSRAAFWGDAEPLADSVRPALPDGDAWKAGLTHQGHRLTLSAEWGAVEKDFEAEAAGAYQGDLLGMHQDYRGYQRRNYAVQDRKGLFGWSRKSLADQEKSQAITEERRSLSLLGGKVEYSSNTLAVDREFAASDNLNKLLMGGSEFNTVGRKFGTAAKALVGAPTQLRGLKDRYETYRLALTSNTEVKGYQRRMELGGATLLDRNISFSLKARPVDFSVTRTEKRASHDFGSLALVGYENWAKEGYQGARHVVTAYNLTRGKLALSRTEDERLNNPSGQAGQGYRTQTETHRLALSGSPIVEVTKTVRGSEEQWAKGETQSTSTRLINWGQRWDNRTHLALSHYQQVDQTSPTASSKYTRLTTNLDRSFADGTHLALSRTTENLADGNRRHTSHYELGTQLGLTATYDEVDNRNAPTSSRTVVQYQRNLSDKLTLTATHRRIKHFTAEEAWKGHTLAFTGLHQQAKESAVGNDVALTLTPSKGTSLTMAHRQIRIDGEGRATGLSLNLTQQVSPGVKLEATAERREMADQKVSAFKRFKTIITPSDKGEFTLAYQEAAEGGTALRPRPEFGMTLRPLPGLTLTGQYVARRSAMEQGGLTTKSWSLSQDLGSGGSLSANYLRNPLNDKGQVVQRSEVKYAFVAPRRWMGPKAQLSFHYREAENALDGPYKGHDLMESSAALNLKGSAHEALALSATRQHGYVSGRHGVLRYNFSYERTFNADHQLVLSGFVANPDGNQDQEGVEKYRAEVKYNLTF